MVTWTRIYVVFIISRLINPSVRARKNMLATRSCNQPYQPAADYPQWFLQSHTHTCMVPHASVWKRITMKCPLSHMLLCTSTPIHQLLCSYLVGAAAIQYVLNHVCDLAHATARNVHASVSGKLQRWWNHDMFICPVRSIEEKLPRAAFFWQWFHCTSTHKF